jgi:hypothetical protein
MAVDQINQQIDAADTSDRVRVVVDLVVESFES